MATLSTPDATLSRRLRARDHAAWEELYLAHGPQLRAFALRLTRNTHEADDLVQETFVRALPRLDRMDPDKVALRPYLFSTLKNTFLKSCERARRVAPVEEVPEPQTPAAIEDDPERSLLLDGQIEEVRSASASLAPRQRLVLALRELEGCSYGEIGAIVGLNENAVAQLLSRARESLRSALRLAQVDTADLPEQCRRLLPQLSRHLDGQLRGEQLERVLDHVEGCDRCLESLQSMREASRRYRVLVPPLLLTDAAHAAAVDARLTAARYWKPGRWRSGFQAVGRWRPRRGRSQSRARRRAVIAAAALLLGGGTLAVAVGQREQADRGAIAEEPSGAWRTPASRIHASSTPAVPTAQPVAPLWRASPAAAADGREKPASPRTRDLSPAATGRHLAGATAPARERPGEVPERRPNGPRSPGTSPGSDPPPAGTPAPANAAETAPTDPGAAADTTRPVTKITSVSIAGDAATFDFSASESPASFACALDASAYAPCTSPKSYTALKPGAHTFAVRATDAAGNTGASESHVWKVVASLPDLVIKTVTDTSFTVANVGTGRAGVFVVSVSSIGGFTINGLAAGETKTVSWSCQSGALVVVADPGDAVAERDETNNSRRLNSRC